MTHITRLLLIWRLIYNIEMHRVINIMKIVRLFSFIILIGAYLSADSNSGNLPAPIPIDFGVNMVCAVIVPIVNPVILSTIQRFRVHLAAMKPHNSILILHVKY